MLTARGEGVLLAGGDAHPWGSCLQERPREAGGRGGGGV